MAGERVPRNYIEGACSRCGAPEQVVNGEWLRARRLAAGLTLREMAKRLGYSAPYVSDIERNNRRCRAVVLRAYEALEAGRAHGG